MKKCIVLFVAVIVLFALSIDAKADPPVKGFYLGGGATCAGENFDDEGLNFDDAWGLNAFAGYRFIKYLAMEGNYNWYSDFESDFFDVNCADTQYITSSAIFSFTPISLIHIIALHLNK